MKNITVNEKETKKAITDLDEIQELIKYAKKDKEDKKRGGLICIKKRFSGKTKKEISEMMAKVRRGEKITK